MAQYDLGFYKDSEWYDCAVITTEAIDLDAAVSLETLPDYRKLYLSFAAGNNGEVLSDASSVAVYVDGEFCRTVNLDPLQPESSRKYTNMEIGTFSAGVHTLEMTLLTKTEDENPADNVFQSTFTVEDTGRGSYNRSCYGGDIHQLDFLTTFELDYGRYTISGNFIGTGEGRKVNAQMDVYNSHRQMVCSISIKNGKLKDKDLVLAKDTYTVRVLSTDMQKTADTVTFSVTGEVYYKSDYGDNSIALVSSTDRYTVTVQDAPRTIVSNGWVGLGDTLSLRRINFELSGKYTFTVKASDQLKITLIQVTSNGKGQKKEKNVTSTTVSGKKKYGKEIAFGGVLLERGTYYLQAEALKADKGTNADFSVKVSPATVFFTDCDNGENNWLYDKKREKAWNSDLLEAAALLIDDSFLEDGNRAIQIDTDTETVIDRKADDGTTFTNYVGFGDDADFRKIELKNAAELSFDLAKTTGGAVKLVVYAVNESGKMVVANSKLTTTVKAAADSGAAKNRVMLDKGVYYLAVQSTDASKGKDAYYSVSLNADSSFYLDGDLGTNDYNGKTKTVNAPVDADSATATLIRGEALQIDGAIDGEASVEYRDAGDRVFTNFVGSGDESDIVKIKAGAGDSVSLKITALDTVTLSVYGLKKGKVKALKSVKLKAAGDASLDYTFQEKDGTVFYVGVTSTNAKKGSAAYYNVEVVSFSGSAAAPLAMPEPDSLAMSDTLRFGQSDTDALADVSSGLTEPDDKAVWQDLLLA